MQFQYQIHSDPCQTNSGLIHAGILAQSMCACTMVPCWLEGEEEEKEEEEVEQERRTRRKKRRQNSRLSRRKKYWSGGGSVQWAGCSQVACL